MAPVKQRGGNPIRYQGVTTATVANVTLPAAVNNTNFYLGFYWSNNANGSGNNPPFVVDDVTVSVPATRIETSAGEPVTESIFSGQDVYLRSTADGQMLARIQNANINLNCITAAITQAGNGTTAMVLANIGDRYKHS